MHSSGTTSPKLFDTTNLNSPLERSAVREFRRHARGNPTYPGLAKPTAGIVISITVWSIVGLLIELIVAALILMCVVSWTRDSVIVIGSTAALSCLLAMLIWRWISPKLRREIRVRGSWRRRLLLTRFAIANDLAYYPVVERPIVIATVLSTGAHRVMWDLFASELLEVGNYATLDPYNRSIAPNGWSFIRIRLDQSVPHLLMLPRRTKVPAKVVAPVKGDQSLHLEGDFDRFFSLFVPSGYERDALYIITPDLMALLIDRVPGAFVEMIGRHLTIAVPRPRDATTESAWDVVADVIATVGRKTLRQTHRYQDDRSAVRGRVAWQGRALRRGVSVASVVAVLIIAARLFQLFGLLHGL